METSITDIAKPCELEINITVPIKYGDYIVDIEKLAPLVAKYVADYENAIQYGYALFPNFYLNCFNGMKNYVTASNY